MTVVQVFSYVAYAFGAIFLIGAIFLLFTIFRKTETDEAKLAKKEAKKASKKTVVEAIPSTSFFTNRQNAQLDLSDNVDAGDKKTGSKPQTSNSHHDEPAPVFNRPKFASNDVNLNPPVKENSKFNLPF